MNQLKSKKILIEGITESGEKFRPSDWAERMSERLCTFHNHRLLYSPLLQPITKQGYQCVILDSALEQAEPIVYQSLISFAKSNNLKICEKIE